MNGIMLKLKRMEQQWQENQGGLELHLHVDHLSELLSGPLILSGKVCCIWSIMHIGVLLHSW